MRASTSQQLRSSSLLPFIIQLSFHLSLFRSAPSVRPWPSNPSFSCLLTFNASHFFTTTEPPQHLHWTSWLFVLPGPFMPHSCFSFSATRGPAIALIHLIFSNLLTSLTPSVWIILSSLPPFQLIKYIPQPSNAKNKCDGMDINVSPRSTSCFTWEISVLSPHSILGRTSSWAVLGVLFENGSKPVKGIKQKICLGTSMPVVLPRSVWYLVLCSPETAILVPF